MNNKTAANLSSECEACIPSKLASHFSSQKLRLTTFGGRFYVGVAEFVAYVRLEKRLGCKSLFICGDEPLGSSFFDFT